MTGALLQLSGIVIDVVSRIEHMPAPGEEVETTDFFMTPGGGFNAMVAARRMGAPVTYGGVLGQGLLAEIAFSRMADEGIACPVVHRAPIDQGVCTVIVDATGERSFITHHGAERKIGRAHLDALPVSSHAFALLTGYSLYKPESAATLLPWLALLPRPPRLLFDPGPTVADISRHALDRVLERSDWVSANAREAQVLTGEAEPGQAALRLAAGREGALVRRGADGCWLAQCREVRHFPGFEVQAIDTNGAGDTHDGVFIAFLMAGAGPAEAALAANAAAAISTTRIGPATAPDATETRQFLETRGARLSVPGLWERVQSGASTAHKEED